MTFLEENAAKNGGAALGYMLIKTCDRKTTAKKLPYLDLMLADSGGEISAKLWDYSPDRHSLFKPGDIVKIKGTVEQYNGNAQLRVERMRAVTEEDGVKLSELVPSAPMDPIRMLSEINAAVEAITDPELSKLVTALLDRCGDRLLACSAAVRMHHTMRGGLLFHTLSMLRVVQSICDVYPFLRRDLCVAGVVVHDLGKLSELELSPTGLASGYSVKGALLSHLVIGAADIARVGAELGTPEETVIMLQHIVVSHHGIPEFGSPIPPMFPEAQVVAAADKLDAELYEMLAAQSEAEPGGLTNRVWGLDRRIYRPSGEEDTEYRLK